jgi:competence protein ComEA
VAVEKAPAREAVRTLGERGIPVPPEPLDINRADAPALQALPGVGPALARRIVAYRESHGPFRTPEDLLRVSGIGAQRYARLRGLVRTREAP